MTSNNQQVIEQLRSILQQTLQPNAAVRRGAEKQLLEISRLPGHPMHCLQIVSQCVNPQDAPIRQAAAVHFKNLVKNYWDEEKDDSVKIPETDRNLIKTHLVDLMCTVPSAIQMQCSEAIALIALVDFPKNWDNLLSDLIGKFSVDDDKMEVVNGVLLTASSILKRFRYVERSDALYSDILYVLKRLQEPLLQIYQLMTKSVSEQQGNLPILDAKLKALRTICRIFFSLNWQDLPEYFEDHMSEWMNGFAHFLQYQNSALIDPDEELESSSLDRLQAAIVDNLNLYANKDEEPFLPHLPRFTTLVWDLLMKTSNFPKHDILAVTCIRFLSSLVGKQMHKSLFENEGTLREIIGKIVVPNLQIRELDEEKFEDDPADFILTDMEGSDSDSRRNCAQDLLKSMCRQFEDQTTGIVFEHVNKMLNDYNSNKDMWGSKDVAIHLFLAASVRAESATHGVSSINEKLDVMDFFVKNILSELQQSGGHAMLKATAIKFVSTFRNQFAAEHLTQLMPMLIHCLSSDSVVVHTYAAATIEKILTTKKQIDTPTKELKFGQENLKPFLESLFTGLFAIVDNENLPENEYVMKAVMRSLSVAREDLVAVTEIVLNKLTASLGRVAKNPKNPHFNHYLFESIAVLVRSVCSKNQNYTSPFESLLFPPFQHVLQMEILEFSPYVFQVLSQLLEYRPDGLSEAYSSLFGPLMTPSLWESKGNVPALTRLVQAYFHKGASQIVAQGFLMPVLGVFQKLVSSKANEANGFALLQSIILYTPVESIKETFGNLFKVLLLRLQHNRTPRFVRLISSFFALFCGKFGGDAYIQQLNNIQAGLGTQIMMQVWLPPLTKDAPATKMDAKIQVIGLTNLLCESPALLNDQNFQKVWTTALTCIMKAISSVGSGVTNDEEEFTAEISYDAVYSKLHFASTPARDPFPEVKNVAQNLATSLNKLCSSRPGIFPPMIQQGLQDDEKQKAHLSSIMQNAGFSLM